MHPPCVSPGFPLFTFAAWFNPTAFRRMKRASSECATPITGIRKFFRSSQLFYCWFDEKRYLLLFSGMRMRPARRAGAARYFSRRRKRPYSGAPTPASVAGSRFSLSVGRPASYRKSTRHNPAPGQKPTGHAILRVECWGESDNRTSRLQIHNAPRRRRAYTGKCFPPPRGNAICNSQNFIATFETESTIANRSVTVNVVISNGAIVTRISSFRLIPSLICFFEYRMPR